MSIKKHVSYALNLFRLHEKAMKEVSQEKAATWWGLLIMAVAGLALGTGFYFTGQAAGIAVSPLIILGSAIFLIIIGFIGIAFLFFFSHLLGGKGTFTHYFRAYSHIYLFNILAAVPVIGLFLSQLVGIWQLVIAIYITKSVRSMSLTKASIVVLVPLIILILLAMFTTIAITKDVFLKYFFTVFQPVQ